MSSAGSHQTAWSGLLPRARVPAALLSWLRWAVFAFICVSSPAQTFTTLNPGPGALKIPGLWQFHTGDNTAWADPAYDDSTWQGVRADVPWAAQGHAGYAGYAWYRKHLKVLPGTSSLGLLIPEAVGAYEVYWNGQVIGRFGRLPPDARWFSPGSAAVFAFPPDTSREGLLCLRFWTPLASTSIDAETLGLRSAPEVGDLFTLRGQIDSFRYRRQYRRLPDVIVASLMLAAGVLSFALFLREPRQRLRLGLTLLLLCNAAYIFLGSADHIFPYTPHQGLMQLFSAGINLGLWIVLLHVFDLHRSKGWRIATNVLSGIYLVAQLADALTQFCWPFAGPGLVRTDAVCVAVYGILEIYPVFLVVFGFARRRTWSSATLGICAALYGSYIPLIDLSSLFSLAAATSILAWHLQLGDFTFTLLTLLNWLLLLILIFIVFRLWTRESRRQVRLEQEIRSAHKRFNTFLYPKHRSPFRVSPLPAFTNQQLK